MIALEYFKWKHFSKVINKAKISCKLSNVNVEDHFTVKGKSFNQELQQKNKLSRYVLFNSSKDSPARYKSIALGQTYFAVQKRKMEITE